MSRIRIPPLLVLCACASSVDLVDPEGSDEELGLAFAQPPGQPLSLVATDPHPGGIVEIVASNANPGELVRFYASFGGIGSGPCPAIYGGQCLDLGGGTSVAGAAQADAAGVAVLAWEVDAGIAVGGRLTFQAAARRGPNGANSVKSGPAVTTVGDPAWAHAITVDGSSADWLADELFDTTSANGALGGVTWDATNVYVLLQHPDVASGGGQHWELVYVGTGAAGGTSGPGLNTQVPALPFAASHVIRRKADGSYDDLQTWDDAQQAWVGTPSWLGTAGSAAAEAGDVLELAIPRAVLDGWTLELALAHAYEGSGFESTYAGVPSDAFVDGYDPDVLTYLLLDLSLPDSPVLQNP